MTTDRMQKRQDEYAQAQRLYAMAERCWALFGMPSDGPSMDALCAAEEGVTAARQNLEALMELEEYFDAVGEPWNKE